MTPGGSQQRLEVRFLEVVVSVDSHLRTLCSSGGFLQTGSHLSEGNSAGDRRQQRCASSRSQSQRSVPMERRLLSIPELRNAGALRFKIMPPPKYCSICGECGKVSPMTARESPIVGLEPNHAPVKAALPTRIRDQLTGSRGFRGFLPSFRPTLCHEAFEARLDVVF